jgi:hypothetical protein
MDDTVNNDEWVCSGSINKVLQGYLLSGFLAIVGLLFLFVLDKSSPDAIAIGYVQLVFAVVVGLLAYRGSRNSGRVLIMNNDGIWYRGWGQGPVPWMQIATIDAGGSRINAFLRVKLGDPGSPRPVLKIPAGDLATPLNEVIEVANGYLSRGR